MRRRELTIAASIVLIVGGSAHADDRDAVRDLMMATFDKPDARLLVDPIVVEGDHAIAGWTQAEMGGRALLRRGGHGWVIALCAGDALREVGPLLDAGIEASAATALVAALREAEATIAPERLAMFARFEGVLHMDETGGHPRGDHQGHGASG